MPSTAAAAMPEAEYGNTTRRIVCQCVAPSARLDSRMARGVVRIVSSATVMIVGSAMIARIRLPASAVSPTGRSKTSRTSGTTATSPKNP